MSKKFIPLEDGHRISYQAYGMGNNTIFLFHGLVGSSWLHLKLISLINGSNIRLIAIERIGYGNSSQFELQHLKDWGPIIQKVVVKLGVKTADVIGISAGAPYAYASAHFLPGIIKKIWILQVFRRFMKTLYSGTTLKTIKSSIKAFCEATFLSYKRPI